MTLEDFGWSSFFEKNLKPDSTKIVGRVSSQHRELYRVLTDRGELVVKVSGRLRNAAASVAELPAVGDWVTVLMRDTDRATIQTVLPRRSYLSRRAAGNRAEEQIIAANVDTVFIVTSLDADFSLRRIERYLLVAHNSGVRPVVILSKSDVAEGADGKRVECETVAQGTPIHVISSVTGDGVEAVKDYLGRGQTVAFVGSSGVGKSTLVNALFGDEIQKTNPVREGDNKGRHTTTYRRLILLPGGALLLDTPGMREVQLWADEGTLDAAFADIATAAEGCRFRDCKHLQEPDCAVRDHIDAGRLASFHAQQKELAHLHRQTDTQAAQAQKQRTKAIHKRMRNYDKRD